MRAPLLWREWGAESVVFNPDSGDTHLLDPLAAEALRRLESAPANVSVLIEHLTRVSNSSAASDLPETVEQMRRAFDDVGLIEPVDDPA